MIDEIHLVAGRRSPFVGLLQVEVA